MQDLGSYRTRFYGVKLFEERLAQKLKLAQEPIEDQKSHNSLSAALDWVGADKRVKESNN